MRIVTLLIGLLMMGIASAQEEPPTVPEHPAFTTAQTPRITVRANVSDVSAFEADAITILPAALQPIGDDDEEDTVTKDQSTLEMVAYRDTWGRGVDSYLHMMFERLILARELLSEMQRENRLESLARETDGFNPGRSAPGTAIEEF